MRAYDSTEYNKVPDQTQFSSFDFLNLGTIVGSIGTVIGQLDVYMIVDGIDRVYGVIEDIGDNISYVGVKNGDDNYWYVRNAFTDPKYQRKGIAKELLLFLLTYEKMHLLSDVEISPSAENLWFSFMKATGRQVKIADIKTSETFTINDIGNFDAHGVEIVAPEDEEDLNVNNLRFFYLIEGSENQNNDSKFGSPIDEKKGLGLLQPNRHF